MNRLIGAIRAGKLKEVRRLIKAGHKIDNNLWSRNPLKIAIDNGHMNIVKYLCYKGAKIWYIHVEEARELHHIDMAVYLIKKRDKEQALKQAAVKGYYDVCERLRREGYGATWTSREFGNFTGRVIHALKIRPDSLSETQESETQESETKERSRPLNVVRQQRLGETKGYSPPCYVNQRKGMLIHLSYLLDLKYTYTATPFRYNGQEIESITLLSADEIAERTEGDINQFNKRPRMVEFNPDWIRVLYDKVIGPGAQLRF